MKKIIKKLLKKIYFNLSSTHLTKKVFATRSREKGEITLFDKPFFYHCGVAFYYAYKDIFNVGIYEFSPGNKNPLIIDCGSNMGLSILFFSKEYPNSRIIAFEPDESVLPYLERDIESQNLLNVELHKKAV